jgi:hypothetical protein
VYKACISSSIFLPFLHHHNSNRSAKQLFVTEYTIQTTLLTQISTDLINQNACHRQGLPPLVRTCPRYECTSRPN